MKQTLMIQSLSDLQSFAQRLVPHLNPGMVIMFQGPLGVGKTTLIQMLARALGVKSHVVSPTFAMMMIHPLPQGALVHVDAYRLTPQHDDFGLDEQAGPDRIIMIEWPSHLHHLPPGEQLKITLSFENEDARKIILDGKVPPLVL